MDALSDALKVMRLTGGLFLHAELCAPWCVSSKIRPRMCASHLGDDAQIIPYHFVLEGRMCVRTEDGVEFEVASGESVLLPRNDWHLLGSDVKLPAVASEEVVEVPADGGLASIMLDNAGPRTRIVCGYLGGEQVQGHPIMEALPSALHLDSRSGGSAEWIRNTFQFAAEQIAAGHQGSEAMMGKLSELLFVEAIQLYVRTIDESGRGWLAGLKDPFVSRALGLMHARIEEPWTVDKLGREIGLSRSALAGRFNEVIGLPPMQYLTNWRIHVAARRLIDSNKPVLQVAQEVGYDSEASFTRAFKRVMNVPPGAWRRMRT
jgi:AraC-like DNA-binding protein